MVTLFCRENASRGTDHGKAGVWFVLGGGVNGGVHGEWPGLSASRLMQGHYLGHSIDFRDVMAALLASHLAAGRLGEVLPGHAYAPIGLFG